MWACSILKPLGCLKLQVFSPCEVFMSLLYQVSQTLIALIINATAAICIRNIAYKLEEKFIVMRWTYSHVFVDEEIGGKLGMKLFIKTENFKALNVGFSLDEGTKA